MENALDDAGSTAHPEDLSVARREIVPIRMSAQRLIDWLGEARLEEQKM
jgi:hypothetical protein